MIGRVFVTLLSNQNKFLSSGMIEEAHLLLTSQNMGRLPHLSGVTALTVNGTEYEMIGETIKDLNLEVMVGIQKVSQPAQ